MKIEIQLYATLARYLPPGAEGKRAVIEVAEDTTVAGLLEYLKIPTEHPNIALVNGLQAEDDAALKDGDVVAVFPPLAGGAVASLTHLRRAPAGRPA